MSSRRRDAGSRHAVVAENIAAWALTLQATAEKLNVDLDRGLTDEEAEARRAQFGANELERKPPTPLWELIAEQFEDMLVRVLLLAAAVSFVLAFFDEEAKEHGLGAFVEPFVILVILIINAFVGVWQDLNASKALEALTSMQALHCKVLRDGTKRQIFARDLVPGDVVYVDVGDKVPADCRVVRNLTVVVRADEAALTGESEPTWKDGAEVYDEGAVIAGKHNMLFSGTTVVSGSMEAVVTTTGMRTEMGRISSAIAEVEDEDTPLRKALDAFGKTLAEVIAVICLLVWVMNAGKFIDAKWDGWVPLLSQWRFDFYECTYYFKIAVALAVAAIPEGLPAVITTCLALGTRKMSQKNAIVRRLPSVETLGCTTVICSDKTGTLTTNQMTCVRMAVLARDGSLSEYRVTGSGYHPADGQVEGLSSNAVARNLDAMCLVAAAANNAALEATAEGGAKCVGVPTEGCLLTLVEKVRGSSAPRRPGTPLTPTCADLTRPLRRVATLEFDRTRKSMSVLAAGVRVGDIAPSGNALLAKGAPDTLLPRCSHVLTPTGSVEAMTDKHRRALAASVQGMAGDALRTLAFAAKFENLGDLASYDGTPAHPGHALVSDTGAYASIESGMVFLGVVGIMDPPRKEVTSAIRECSTAGIRVIMITGDNRVTAEAISRDIGILARDSDASQHSVEGGTFMSWPEPQQLEFLSRPGGKVFSRAEPTHKLRIVGLLQREGEVVAMTGDGVNDAPALKKADIGVAMGVTGTEVAKEAADMVLADDNFLTIVAAVSEGRAIYNNMKAFIRYMISSNIGEVASIFITAMCGLPEGLAPVQLLWVNLVTDGPPATALSFNPQDPDIMSKPPRRKTEGLVSFWILLRWLIVGTYVGAATVGIFAVWYTRTSFAGVDFSADGHSPVSLAMLRRFGECNAQALQDPHSVFYQFNPAPFIAGSGPGSVFDFRNIGPGSDPANDPCEYFDLGRNKASTLALSVLVVIEMLNAMNALSETHSILEVPPWVNPYLCLAIVGSILSHCLILYIPLANKIFNTVPLTLHEWLLVLVFSAPVIVIEEAFKLVVGVTESASAAKVLEEQERARREAVEGAKKDQ